MDRRVVRTLALIKKTFLDMVQKMPLREITIVALAQAAGINRRTFYMHYDAIEDLIADIEKDCVDEIDGKLSELDEEDLQGGILMYYRFLEDAEPGIQTLLYGREYEGFYERLEQDVLSLEFFSGYCGEDSSTRCLVRGYLGAISAVYRDRVAGIAIHWKSCPGCLRT